MKTRSEASNGKGLSPAAGKDNGVYLVTRILALMLLPVCFRIIVHGRDNIPKTGPFVLLPKHQRWVDVPLIGLAAARYLYYIAKAELFVHPLGNWFISALGGIPLNRKRPIESRQTLRAIRRCLQSDSGLVLFPEGTYYPGIMGPGHQGVLRFITSVASVPLIPVGIRYEKQTFRTRVTIHFGTPIQWAGKQEDYDKLKAFDKLKASEKLKAEDLLPTIMKDIARLSGLKMLR